MLLEGLHILTFILNSSRQDLLKKKKQQNINSFLIPTTHRIASCWLRVPDKEDFVRHLTDKTTRLLSKELRTKVELHLRLCWVFFLFFFTGSLCETTKNNFLSQLSYSQLCNVSFTLQLSLFPVCLFTEREIIVVIAFILNTPQYWSLIHASMCTFDFGAHFIIALRLKRHFYSLVLSFLHDYKHDINFSDFFSPWFIIFSPFFNELSFRFTEYNSVFQVETANSPAHHIAFCFPQSSNDQQHRTKHEIIHSCAP